MYSNQVYQAVALINDVPIWQQVNGSLVGYGNQCVKDFSVGVDNALWAISCLSDANSSTNFQIIKWDPFLSQWYVVPGKSGVKISAFNEISAAVLTAEGLIFVSSDTGDKALPAYINRTGSVGQSMFTGSSILNTESQQWIRSHLQYGYGNAVLAWKGSTNGLNS